MTHCLGCQFQETPQNQVTLLDGTSVCSSCEAWRHETEARWVLARPTTQDRRAYLEAVERKRGTPAADHLRATILLLWEARKSAPPETVAKSQQSG
jgi:hypothetical protein